MIRCEWSSLKNGQLTIAHKSKATLCKTNGYGNGPIKKTALNNIVAYHSGRDGTKREEAIQFGRPMKLNKPRIEGRKHQIPYSDDIYGRYTKKDTYDILEIGLLSSLLSERVGK